MCSSKLPVNGSLPIAELNALNVSSLVTLQYVSISKD